MAVVLRFGFDQVSKLSEIRLVPKKAAPDVSAENPIESMFDGFQVVDDGKTVTITSKAVNPLADQKDQLKDMPGVETALKSQVEAILRGLRVVFKITAPFEVIEHNAHRKEGSTLVWDFNMETFEKMAAGQVGEGIRAKFRK